MNNVVEFSQKTTITLDDGDYALVVRKCKDTLGVETYTPRALREAAEKDPNAQAPLEFILMTFFQLAFIEDDVLEAILDLVTDYMITANQNTKH